MQNSSLRRRYCKKISMLSSAEEEMHFKSHWAERGEAAPLVPLYTGPLGYGLGTSAASVLCDPCFQRCTWMLWASSPDMQLARCKNRSCSIWRAQREGPATLHCCKALPLIRQWPGKIWPHFNFYSYLCHIFFQGSMKNVTKVPQSIIFGIGRLWT